MFGKTNLVYVLHLDLVLYLPLAIGVVPDLAVELEHPHQAVVGGGDGGGVGAAAAVVVVAAAAAVSDPTLLGAEGVAPRDVGREHGGGDGRLKTVANLNWI